MVLFLGLLLAPFPSAEAQKDSSSGRFPDIILITVDTLRLDRISAYGYQRQTSPAIDALLDSGQRFTSASTVEPLTSPSLCSVITSRYPHEHGSTRNGLRMRPGLSSLPKVLGRRGYRTAAFVGNWTLRDRLSGLGEHFERYEEVFTRKRWLGLFNSEATAVDLTDQALEWIQHHQETARPRPMFLWVHFVEPHAPYRFQSEFASRLGISQSGSPSAEDRYDTEVAFVDHEIARLIAGLRQTVGSLDSTLIVFAADHGENLGENSYWGHGRHVYGPANRVPLGITWPRRIRPGIFEAQTSLIDLGPTILGLIGLAADDGFRGTDLSKPLLGLQAAPQQPILLQAHKGAVHSDAESRQARKKGLLEVAILRVDGRKEVLDLRNDQVRLYDSKADPMEATNLATATARPSADLLAWLEAVRSGLQATADLPPADVDSETIERLRALGYID